MRAKSVPFVPVSDLTAVGLNPNRSGEGERGDGRGQPDCRCESDNWGASDLSQSLVSVTLIYCRG